MAPITRITIPGTPPTPLRVYRVPLSERSILRLSNEKRRYQSRYSDQLLLFACSSTAGLEEGAIWRVCFPPFPSSIGRMDSGGSVRISAHFGMQPGSSPRLTLCVCALASFDRRHLFDDFFSLLRSHCACLVVRVPPRCPPPSQGKEGGLKAAP